MLEKSDDPPRDFGSMDGGESIYDKSVGVPSRSRENDKESVWVGTSSFVAGVPEIIENVSLAVYTRNIDNTFVAELESEPFNDL